MIQLIQHIEGQLDDRYQAAQIPVFKATIAACEFAGVSVRRFSNNIKGRSPEITKARIALCSWMFAQGMPTQQIVDHFGYECKRTVARIAKAVPEYAEEIERRLK